MTVQNIHLITLICILSFTIAGFTQEKNRLEFEVKPNAAQPEVIPLGETGCIVLNPKNIIKENGRSFIRASCYNTDLDEKWKKEIDIPKRLSLSHYEYLEKKLYLIFSKSNREDLQILTIEPASGNMKTYDFYVLKGLNINDFTVFNDRLIIGGTVKNRPIIQEMNLNTIKVRTLPTAIEGKSVTVDEVFINKYEKSINTVVNYNLNKKKSALIRTFSNKGNKFTDLIIHSDKKFDIHTAKLTQLSDEVKLVLGTYGHRKSESSQGFYIAKFINEEQEFLRYYSFTDLKNFFSFLGDKAKSKTESRVQRKKDKGKDLRLKYRLLTHELVSRKGQYLMIGEAYYPVYRRERYVEYYGLRRVHRSRMVFEGNQFTHAVIAGFNENGELLWDNTFKISDIKTRDLQEKVKAYFNSDNITLFYNLEGKINKITINENKDINDPQILTLNTEFKGDQIKRSNLGATAFWYDNYFIAWGYQKIKNLKNEDVKRKRNIFYVNKMSF